VWVEMKGHRFGRARFEKILGTAQFWADFARELFILIQPPSEA